MILLVTGCLVLVLPSGYDGKHRGAMVADFSCWLGQILQFFFFDNDRLPPIQRLFNVTSLTHMLPFIRQCRTLYPSAL
ncbi:hypothetical protein A2U01_0063766, partial [Trifolium medium]|nr:hypothetical protein [Trifolium medium]